MFDIIVCGSSGSGASNLTVMTALVAPAVAVLTWAITRLLEARAIQQAVYAELVRLLGVVKSHQQVVLAWRSERVHDQPLVHFSTDVFDANKEAIGRLDRALVAEVVMAYGWIRFLNALQDARADYRSISTESTHKSGDDEFIKVYLDALAKFTARTEIMKLRTRLSAKLSSQARTALLADQAVADQNAQRV